MVTESDIFAKLGEDIAHDVLEHYVRTGSFELPPESPFSEDHLLGAIGSVRIYAFHLPDDGAVFRVLPADDTVWSEVLEMVRTGSDPIVLTPMEEAALFMSSGWQRRRQ